MLIAVDFSETATNAAKWATEYFAPDAEFALVHVVELPHRPVFANDTLPPDDEIAAIARQHAEGRMDELATVLTAGPAHSEVRIGKAHEQVAAAALDFEADIVVIGPHGDRPRPSRFLGTTAERIARTSPVPVLVVTHPPAGAPERLLAPVEDASITAPVLAWTKELAQRFDAEVTLLHVWSNAIYSHVASMSYATTRTEGEARAEIQKELHDAAAYWLAEIAETGIARDGVSAVVKWGHAGDVAVTTAAEMKAQLIVLGRRGSGSVGPALLGSTVGTVLHGARCPVLVVTEPHG
jgi:nucleotide-binding universal stress UspA family protein